jgi:hypothetical protein
VNTLGACLSCVFTLEHRLARMGHIVDETPASRAVIEHASRGDLMRTRIIRSLLWAAAVLLLSTSSFAQVGASITIAPPELPVYEQPVSPGDGYIWTPGYWAWDGEYYWVPGTWVMPPEVGLLWTPGYWGWSGGGFLFNDGYWGPSVGFYGGIDYGFGYFGHGYEGGRWDKGHFFYNTGANRAAVNHISYNGGNGGITERASAQEETAARGRHLPPVAEQTQHAWMARNAPQQRVSANHGAPSVVATPRPSLAVHPRDLPPVARVAPPNTGNPKQGQQYQQQQEQLFAKQNQDRQALQQKQDREHQQQAQQQVNQARTQQAEQRHQQETQQLQQRHTQQTQQMQQRQQPRGGGARGGGGGRR